MMDYMWRKMKEMKKEDSGFTLIELLIVILILGILAAIAIFASEPFRERAAAACEDANDRIEFTGEVAQQAGVQGDLYAFEAGNCQTGEGGTGTPGGGSDSPDNFGVTSALIGSGSVGAAGANVMQVMTFMAPSAAGTTPSTHQGFTLRGSYTTATNQKIAVYSRLGGAAVTLTPPADWPAGTVVEGWAFTKAGGDWANVWRTAFTGSSSGNNLSGNVQAFTGTGGTFTAHAGPTSVNSTFSVSVGGKVIGSGTCSGCNGMTRGSQANFVSGGTSLALTGSHGGTGAYGVVVVVFR